MKKHAFRTKAISVLIAAVFALNTIAIPLSFTAAHADNVSPLPPSQLKELNADTFTLPQELGYIKESVKLPNSPKTVIHIQDAHCNYAAQKKIAEILNYLNSEYGTSAVNCEGASEGYDLTPFTSIPEKDIREKTSDYFVKEGLVSAAEFFAVNNPDKVKLWGIEDPDLYMRNLKVYRESLGYKEAVEKDIKSIGYILANLKRHIYSPELLDFDERYSKYKDGKITFKEYLIYLVSIARKNAVNVKEFPDVFLLAQTLEEEEKINFKRADREKDEVVDLLKKTLSRNELEELTLNVAKMKAERITQGEFYAYLVKKARSIKIDLKAYPELEKYVIYISIYSAVDKTRVSKEIDSLEDRIKDALYENDTQRELGVLSKNLVLEKNMFNISLTSDDYAYYRKYRASFAVANFIRFIDAHAPLYKIQAKLDGNIGSLDAYREKMEAFYECSLERDKAFVKNIKFTDHDRPNSIIITGGFHTENLRELFAKENVSYVAIMPKFTNPPGYESPYLKRLAGQRTALENVIDTAIPAVLNLAVVEILSNKLAIEVEGRTRLTIYKLAIQIVAALNRGQDFVLKVSKNIPVKGYEKNEEEKFITFSEPQGAEITSSVELASSASGTALIGKENATLAMEGDLLAVHLRSEQPAAQVENAPVNAPAATIGGVPVYQPIGSVDEKGFHPSAAKVEITAAERSPEENISNIINLAREPQPDRSALVAAIAGMLSDRSKAPEIIRSILDAISGIDKDRVKNEMIMALRTAIAIKGLGEIRPRGLDVVVQIAPFGQRSGAANANRIVEDRLVRNYNGVIAKSIIGEGVTDVAGLKAVIAQARAAMADSKDPDSARALLLLPHYLQGIHQAALKEAGADKDVRIRTQFVEQGEMPDLVTQFELGVELIEYVRDGEKPEDANQRLLDLITVMVDSKEDPRKILEMFFKQIPIKIRPVNWQTLDEQRKAWEAVAKSL